MKTLRAVQNLFELALAQSLSCIDEKANHHTEYLVAIDGILSLVPTRPLRTIKDRLFTV